MRVLLLVAVVSSLPFANLPMLVSSSLENSYSTFIWLLYFPLGTLYAAQNIKIRTIIYIVIFLIFAYISTSVLIQFHNGNVALGFEVNLFLSAILQTAIKLLTILIIFELVRNSTVQELYLILRIFLILTIFSFLIGFVMANYLNINIERLFYYHGQRFSGFFHELVNAGLATFLAFYILSFKRNLFIYFIGVFLAFTISFVIFRSNISVIFLFIGCITPVLVFLRLPRLVVFTLISSSICLFFYLAYNWTSILSHSTFLSHLLPRSDFRLNLSYELVRSNPVFIRLSIFEGSLNHFLSGGLFFPTGYGAAKFLVTNQNPWVPERIDSLGLPASLADFGILALVIWLWIFWKVSDPTILKRQNLGKLSVIYSCLTTLILHAGYMSFPLAAITLITYFSIKRQDKGNLGYRKNRRKKFS